MSTESIFINELKFDAKKDIIKQFIYKNIAAIATIFFTILVLISIYLSVKLYKSNKIEKFNEKIFMALEAEKPENELKNIYENKNTPRISKTFAGLNLIANLKEYNGEHEKIYNDIFENEKDLFFKYYAGLNLLILKIENKKSAEEIEKFIKVLEVDKNPLINFVLEQKALFLKEQNKNDEAKKILQDLLKKNLDNGFIKRINQHMLYIN